MKIPFKLRVEEGDIAALAQHAEEHERTVAAEVRLAIRQYLMLIRSRPASGVAAGDGAATGDGA